MSTVLPFKANFRKQLASHLAEASAAQDPLTYLQDNIFTSNPDHADNIKTFIGRDLASFFWDVVRYCEVSAWAEEPPLIVTLLEAFKPRYEYSDVVKDILLGGPYRCHPSTQPFWVCRVASELPLFKRHATRVAAIQFGSGMSIDGQPGHRVLRVDGPSASGKSHTLTFFTYLAAIQPERVGILHLDFGEGDLATLAENEGMLVELYIARRLEEQAKRWRRKLTAIESAVLPMPVGFPGQPAPPSVLIPAAGEYSFRFTELSDLQQRTRWAGQLATEFVKNVLERATGVPPRWWVVVFDRCEKIPQQAEEFVRQLVQRAAGADRDSAEQADKGQLRVVLLGNSSLVIPSPIYQDHIIEEDLTNQAFGQQELEEYFGLFCVSRLITLDNDPQVHLNRVKQLATESITRATEIMSSLVQKPPWPKALALAVNEKTEPLEAQVAQRRTGAQPPQNGGGE